LLDLNGDGRTDILSRGLNAVFFGRDISKPMVVDRWDADVEFSTTATYVGNGCDIDADGDDELAVRWHSAGANMELFLGGPELLGPIDLDARPADLSISPSGPDSFVGGGCLLNGAEPLFLVSQWDGDCATQDYYVPVESLASSLSVGQVAVSDLAGRRSVSDCDNPVGGRGTPIDVDADGIVDLVFSGELDAFGQGRAGGVYFAPDDVLDLSQVSADVTVVADEGPVDSFWPVGDLDGDGRVDLICRSPGPEWTLFLIQGNRPPPRGE
jgi:hypothetical protein